MIKIFFLIILINIFLFKSVYANQKPIRFIAIGHLYPIIDDTIRMNKLMNKINSYEADYLFILGDSKLHDKKYLNYFRMKTNSKIFFSPGNHELSRFKSEYSKNVGYLNKVIIDENIKFLLVNSSQDKNEINEFLSNNLKEKFKGVTILLTHHRIWDDTLMSAKSYGHDKSYYFEEIYPVIKNKINAIFSGNSKRQHFRDLTDDKLSFGKQNVNLIYWLDKIGSIDMYSIGMGDGIPKANFVVVDIIDNELYVKGDYSSLETYDILPKNLIEKNELRLTLHNTKGIRNLVKNKYFLINKNKTYIAITTIIIIFIFLIIKLRKNEKN